MTDLLADAESRYTAARARRAAVEREWKARGMPMLGSGSRGQLQEHPLLAALRAHDMLLLKLAAPLRKANAGPSPSAVVRPFRVITRPSKPRTKKQPG
jgi:hypothetical protein